MRCFFLVVVMGAMVMSAEAQDIVGDWAGTLHAGAVDLRLVVHITKSDNGYNATFDSVDQGANGIPINKISLDGQKLSFTSEKVHGSYEGTVNSDSTAIEGTWTQGAPLPLNLKRMDPGAAMAGPKRPQNPVKPYPYHEEELTYENKTAGVTLAATLTIPEGKGPFPAVALITGSGPQDRDESLMGHKPFLVLADYLTRHGIAVLRTDDRGVAKSTGDFKAATTADFATDTEAAIAYLKTRPEVNAKKIGLIGHSEGGAIAPMVAARNPDVAFIVMLAGPGVPGDQLLVAQVGALDAASGVPPAMVTAATTQQRQIEDLVLAEKDNAVLKQKLKEKLQLSDSQADLIVKQLGSVWFRYFLAYDPAVSLRKVTCPVLALDGDKDVQVPAKQNLPAIRKALDEAGNKHYVAEEVPGVNHLFQTAKTGAPTEYAQIEETMSPVVLERVASWVLKQ